MWNIQHIQKQLQKEEAVFEYRSKLRTPQCSNHSQNIRSNCAKCRALFWLDCLEIARRESKKEPTVGLVNTIKSERGNQTQQ